MNLYPHQIARSLFPSTEKSAIYLDSKSNESGPRCFRARMPRSSKRSRVLLKTIDKIVSGGKDEILEFSTDSVCRMVLSLQKMGDVTDLALGQATGTSVVGVAGSPGGGPYIILKLTIMNGRIVAASAESNGCLAAMMCSSLTARLIVNRSLAQASRLDASDLLVFLKDFVGPKERYAPMAVQALNDALGKVE